jgi:hypothetical protein
MKLRWANHEIQWANNDETIGKVRWIDVKQGYSAQEQDIHFPDSRTAVLRGAFIDYVQSIGDIWEPNWLESLDPQLASSYLTNIFDFCRRSSRIAAETLDISCAQIAVAGDIGPDILLRARLAKKFFSDGMAIPHPRESKYVGYQFNRDLLIASRYAEQLRSLHSRRVFISNTGYVGLAPSHVAVGDRLCIFLGGNSAYTLRPALNGSYTLVGEAYVHGIMYGEFVATDPPIESIAVV